MENVLFRDICACLIFSFPSFIATRDACLRTGSLLLEVCLYAEKGWSKNSIFLYVFSECHLLPDGEKCTVSFYDLLLLLVPQTQQSARKEGRVPVYLTCHQ